MENLTLYQKDLATAATAYLTAVKLHLRVDSSTEDSLITSLIKSGIEYLEVETDQDFVAGTYDYTMSDFPNNVLGRLTLPRSPLASVTHVKYYDDDNTLQTWISSKYHVILRGRFRGFIQPTATEYFPVIYSRPDAIQIRFVTGSTPPNRFLHALNLYCGIGFENRQDEGALKGCIQALIDQLNVTGYA